METSVIYVFKYEATDEAPTMESKGSVARPVIGEIYEAVTNSEDPFFEVESAVLLETGLVAL